jgi:hypothetical protein
MVIGTRNEDNAKCARRSALGANQQRCAQCALRCFRVRYACVCGCACGYVCLHGVLCVVCVLRACILERARVRA